MERFEQQMVFKWRHGGHMTMWVKTICRGQRELNLDTSPAQYKNLKKLPIDCAILQDRDRN